jgi:hypothetical protein
LVVRAMPWIYTDFSRGFKPNNENYKMFVAVDDAKGFKTEFDEMLRSRLPGQSGLSSLSYEESGIPGQIICYCEISGLPLDAIASIKSEWRPSYLREQGKPDGLPLHNHKDDLRFPEPVVPSNAELDELRSRIKIYLQGTMLGSLRFNVTRRVYEMEAARNHWDPVGDEKYLRRRGFQPSQQTVLTEQIKRAEDKLTFLQFLALAALAEWYSGKVYTPKRVEVQERGALLRKGGIGHHTSRELEAIFTTNAQRIGGNLPANMTVADAKDRLIEEIHQWTKVITGTLDDVEDSEVGRDLDDPIELRATDKRTINWAAFTDESLISIITRAEEEIVIPASVAANANPPVAAAVPILTPASLEQNSRFWLFSLDGQVVGPHDRSAFQMLAQLGQLRGDMKVCREGTQVWQVVADVSQLAELLQKDTSVAPPPPPTTPTL